MSKYENIPLLGVVITAFLSTLCCLPAFIFLFFGLSSSFLVYFTSLDYLRIPMAIISLLFFLFAIKRYKEKIVCSKSKEEKIKHSIMILFIFFFMIFLLFYPEIIPYFMEDL